MSESKNPKTPARSLPYSIANRIPRARLSREELLERRLQREASKGDREEIRRWVREYLDRT